MFSINRFVFPVAKLFAPTVFVLFAVSGFATPAADILDGTHAAVQAVMAVQEEVTPALHVNSWLDVTPDATLHAFNLMRRNATSARGRDNQFVIMSPTTHCASEAATEHTKVGAMDVGDARNPYWRLYLDWFDHYVFGDPIPKDSPLRGSGASD